MDRHARLEGCLLGTAIGDALLLPDEGLSRQRIRQGGRLRHRLIFGCGVLSDDTEHAFLTAQALLASQGDDERFGAALGWRLRGWLLGLPPGIGLATLRACLRLWLGWSWRTSGVDSAGNGAAMCAAVLGAALADDTDRRRRLVTISARITHVHPLATTAAIAVAEAAAWIMGGSGDEDALLAAWRGAGDDPVWSAALACMIAARSRDDPVSSVAAALGQPDHVSGYAGTSVPVALYAWWRHRADLPAALVAIRACGGDVDSMGAIAGALSGTEGGVDRCPPDWLGRLIDWPLSIRVLRRLAVALANGGRHVRWCWPLQPLRGFLVLLVALGHGYVRMFVRMTRQRSGAA